MATKTLLLKFGNCEVAGITVAGFQGRDPGDDGSKGLSFTGQTLVNVGSGAGKTGWVAGKTLHRRGI